MCQGDSKAKLEVAIAEQIAATLALPQMSQFSLERELSSALCMDAPLAKGPLPRWQRKALETSGSSKNSSVVGTGCNSSTLNSSYNQSSNGKTPSKTPGKSKLTPGRNQKTPKTPNTNSGDRFIPNRGAMQFDISHYLVTQDKLSQDTENLSPNSKEYARVLSETMTGDLSNFRIMAYQNKAPPAPEGHANSMKVVYSCSKMPGSSRKNNRVIPQVPEKILDAPEIVDDYYLNLLDWSANNHLAVALSGHVYLWNAATGDIHQLFEMEDPGNYIASVSWIKEGNVLAVGTSTGEVELWNVENSKRLRVMRSHTARVGSLSWNSYILSSGSRSGVIHHHDVRIPDSCVGIVSGHSQEICGLRWSLDGKYLASGGNDNTLNIWSTAMALTADVQPVFRFTHHQAAVKALAWCPWQPHILASGGGTADRHIRFWNCNLGSHISEVDTKSQVCSILWSNEYKELISGHGFANNELIIWKYPTMAKVAELTGHTARVLHLSMSPDGSTVVSAGADETLRIWNCFAVDEKRKKQQQAAYSQRVSSVLRLSIR